MKRRNVYRARGVRELAVILGVCLMTAGCALVLGYLRNTTNGAETIGVTFSSRFAQDLNLVPTDVFSAVVEEIPIDHVRIPLYWNDIERAPSEWDFTDADALMTIAAHANVPVTLVVGMRVPRWPECFVPSFYDASSSTFDDDVLRYVAVVVERYKDHPALVRWQVENETLFLYGECPSPSLALFQQEIALVRSIDPAHPIMLTVSGEQESWLDVASAADVVGVSMYRFAYNRALGPFSFPHRPAYYRLHALIADLFSDDVIVSELQMEPWFVGSPQDPSQLVIPFSAQDFSAHMQFVQRSGMREVLLWGVEWWYYTKAQGDPSLWNAAKTWIKP